MMSLPPGHDHEASLPELLTRPLADNAELRLYVEGDLAQRMISARLGPGDDTAEQAAVRLAALPPSSGKHWKRRWGAASLTLTILWLVALAMEIPGFLLGQGLFSDPSLKFVDDLTTAHAHSLIAPGSPFDFSWESDGYWQVSADRAWREHPDDPAFYYVYCMYQVPVKGGTGLPADFDTVWHRLDPDNAAWPLLKAYRATSRAIDPKSTRGSRKGLVVADPLLFAEGIASLKEAAGLSRFTSFQPLLRRRFQDSLLTPRTLAEVSALRSLKSATFPAFFPKPDLLLLEARRLAAAGDMAALADFLKSIRIIMLRSLDPARMGSRKFSPGLAKDIAAIAAAAGIPSEESRFTALYRLLVLPFPDRGDDPAPPDTVSGYLKSLDDLTAARLAVSARWYLHGATGLLLAAAWLLWARGAPFRGAAERCADCLWRLFTGKEQLRRIVLPAILLPLALLAVTLPFLPAGEMSETSLAGQALMLAGFAVLGGLILLVELSYWETSRKIAFLSLAKNLSQRGPFIVGPVFSLLPLATLFGCFYGMAHDSWIAGPLKFLAGLLVALPLLGIVAGYLRGLFPARASISHRLIARLLVPPLLGLAAAVLLAAPLLHGLERRLVAHWITANDGTAPDVPVPAFSALIRQLGQDWGVPESAGKTNEEP